MKKLLLIDGSSFAYRAFHAMPNLTAPTGELTGAIYGIVNMLKQLQKKYSDFDHWCCVFDSKGKTFRDHLYPEYKAQRAKTPPELINQFNYIYTLVKAIGIPLVMQEGVEADDIIGSMAVQGVNAGYQVLIATGDKDFAQLVNKDITLVNTMTNENLDYNGVIGKFGVRPEQIIDYLVLIGDKVDNIPGVDKCGPKTASKWLNEFDSLDNLILNKDKLTGVVGENFRQSVDWLVKAKQLVTIDLQLKLNDFIENGDLDLLQYHKADENILREVYAKLGFKTWLNQLSISNSSLDKPLESPQIDLISTSKKGILVDSTIKLNEMLSTILETQEKLGIVVVPNIVRDILIIEFVLISFRDIVYIIYNTKLPQEDLFTDDTSLEPDLVSLLKPLFTSINPKIISNYKYTQQILKQFDLNLTGVVGDLVLAHYVKNSRKNHSLSFIYQEYLNITLLDLMDMAPKKTNSEWFKLNDINRLDNCKKIADNLIELEQKIVQSLDSQELKLYQQIEVPLAQILFKVEEAGITLDINQFKILEVELATQLKDLENIIYAESGLVFNINSNKQLQEVLFENMKLPTLGIKKNTNGYSTDEDSLTILDGQGITIARSLLTYRTLNKLQTTYITKLPLLVDNKNKLHTTFDQALVLSGRLSSRDPNLQNIPIKNEWGQRIRKCFTAEPGYVLICADYSQIELRILAHISGDENLVSAFNNKEDIHSKTASEIFNKPMNEVSHDERRYAKIINFSLLYGKTIFGLAQELKIDRVTAKNYIDAYFAKYPKIKSCMEDIKSFAHTHEFVQTVFGRKIYLPDINSSNRILRDATERVALNSPMQGTSADIIKLAMCRIDKWLIKQKLQTKIILQIHDELILQVPLVEVGIIENCLPDLMTSDMPLSVALTVNLKTANNWGEAH